MNTFNMSQVLTNTTCIPGVYALPMYLVAE